MPTYEYRCTSCDHTFDRVQRMSDDPVASCPQCDSKTERLVSGGAGFLLKGDGFYITDSRSESYKKKAEQDTGKAAQDAGKAAQDAGSSDSSSTKKSESASSSSDSKSSSAASSPSKGDVE